MPGTLKDLQDQFTEKEIAIRLLWLEARNLGSFKKLKQKVEAIYEQAELTKEQKLEQEKAMFAAILGKHFKPKR